MAKQINVISVSAKEVDAIAKGNKRYIFTNNINDLKQGDLLGYIEKKGKILGYTKWIQGLATEDGFRSGYDLGYISGYREDGSYKYSDNLKDAIPLSKSAIDYDKYNLVNVNDVEHLTDETGVFYEGRNALVGVSRVNRLIDFAHHSKEERKAYATYTLGVNNTKGYKGQKYAIEVLDYIEFTGDYLHDLTLDIIKNWKEKGEENDYPEIISDAYSIYEKKANAMDNMNRIVLLHNKYDYEEERYCAVHEVLEKLYSDKPIPVNELISVSKVEEYRRSVNKSVAYSNDENIKELPNDAKYFPTLNDALDAINHWKKDEEFKEQYEELKLKKAPSKLTKVMIGD